MKNLINEDESIIKSILIKWYRKNKRNLPWRISRKNSLPDPYYVFVSEYMLQQTTVGTVKSKFEKFIIKWPSINSLANISEEKILIFWAGLGYYSRAKNLLKAAKIIKKNFNSKIPNSYNSLITLPGIGDYTAKAILGIAYNKAVMPLDANIKRILARLYGFKLPLNKINIHLQKKSDLFVSKKYSSNLIQAFMDYGSLICKPKNPDCINCLIKSKCISYKNNLQNIIPAKTKIKLNREKKYSRAYIFFNEKNEILVRKRNPLGMLPSMIEVPNDEWVKNKSKLVIDKFVSKIKDTMHSKGVVEYSFSHFDLETEVFFLKVLKKKFSHQKWIKKRNINISGLPTVMKKIIETAL